MIRKIGLSVVIQMLGTLCSLLLVWLITNKYGVEVQGQFVLIKSWIDLAVVTACFGLPQSFVYGINQLNISLKQLEKFTIKYMFLVCFGSLITTYIWFEYIQLQSFLNNLSYLFIALGIAFLTSYNLMRGLFLTLNDGSKFAYVTIAPAMALFLIFLTYSFLHQKTINFSLIYLLSSFLAFYFVYLNLRNFNKSSISLSYKNIPWRMLINNGFSVFIQSLASTLLPLGTYWLMTEFGFDKKQVGLFSIALYVYMVFTLPLNMVAPIFFNKWSKAKDIKSIKNEVLKFAKIGVILIPVVLICYLLIPKLLPIVFGSQVVEVITPTRILLSAIVALYFNNLLTCFLMSQGHFKKISMIYVFKTFSCLTITVLLIIKFNSLNSVALSWVATEYLILLILSLIIWRKYAIV
ncbi:MULTISPECIES: hypothetical protein [Acinetobacter]|uniref:hypothetical protein n=1 Tax=Acinetobacter TaxID=469 RepID=UPI000C606607|nr:hypothetical protein [Acinetobacter sp.]MBC70089.1 hypothetical protein [Acinetobacter sp.]MBT50193.1 hypothetical protein [Acinetobacter sp.]|tara:strand:+ start:821 stop:2041 length:1221 start_codon:yes stop_codon:yes gene_type:complete